MPSWHLPGHASFVYGRSRVQTLVQRSAILTEVFGGFLSPSSKMSAKYLKCLLLDFHRAGLLPEHKTSL
jgi:hypothetical protein